MIKVKSTEYINYWQGCGETVISHIAVKNMQWCNHSGKLFDKYFFKAI